VTFARVNSAKKIASAKRDLALVAGVRLEELRRAGPDEEFRLQVGRVLGAVLDWVQAERDAGSL
jgi:hypothetical protein